MGKRKFRLKYIKNYKREKYVGKKLVVSIPLSSLPSSMSSSFVSSQSMIVQIPIYNYTLLLVHMQCCPTSPMVNKVKEYSR